MENADDFMSNEIYTPQIGEMQTKGTAKVLNIFFIVDVSGSMRAEGKIDAVNEAFTQMIPSLRQIQMDNMSEFELRIAIMTFEQTARWIVPPTSVMEYSHEDIQCSQGVTFFSEAFNALGEKLTSKEYMDHAGKMAAPYIMFMTDGEPTLDDNYKSELDSLLGNGWFKASQRFAVLIGRNTINSPAARAAVSRFVTSEAEGIINAADAAAIATEVQAKTIHTVANMTKHGVSASKPNPSIDAHSVYSLDLPERITTILIKEGLDTLDKIVSCTEEDIINVIKQNGFSEDNAELVIQKFKDKGLVFNFWGTIDDGELSGFCSPTPTDFFDDFFDEQGDYI